MVVHNLAFTAPINEPGVRPILSVSQLWQGLQRKIVAAQEFVPAIVDCKVLEQKEDENEVTREVLFKEGFGPKTPVKEVVRSFEPARVDFHQTDGSVVRNIISEGAGGAEDLYMTYIFEWRLPDIEEGSDKDKETLAHHKKIAQMAVEKSIETIRNMVVEGKFQ